MLSHTGVQPGDFEPLEVAKSVLPGALWVGANNLAFVAMANLDAVTNYTVMNYRCSASLNLAAP